MASNSRKLTNKTTVTFNTFVNKAAREASINNSLGERTLTINGIGLTIAQMYDAVKALVPSDPMQMAKENFFSDAENDI